MFGFDWNTQALLIANDDSQGKRNEWIALQNEFRRVIYTGRQTVSWSLAKPILEPLISKTVHSVQELTSVLSVPSINTEAARKLASEIRDQLNEAYDGIMPLLTHYLDERGALLDKLHVPLQG